MNTDNSAEELKCFGVYRIKSPSGSTYIGMTADSFVNRWKGHLKDLRNGSHKCAGLRNAYSKYGESKLIFEVLEVVPDDSDLDILALEQLWWDRFKAQGTNLYNGRPTGTGSVHHTEETKSRIASSLLNDSTRTVIECANCNKAFEIYKRKLKAVNCCSTSCSVMFNRKIKRGELDVRVIELHMQGYTTRAIAKELGTYQQKVWRIIQKHNAPVAHR